MTREEAINMGFKELPYFTVCNNLVYDLGRYRELSFGNIGTPNEMLFILSMDKENRKKSNDAVCLHNYDYDGYMTKDKLESLIKGITG